MSNFDCENESQNGEQQAKNRLIELDNDFYNYQQSKKNRSKYLQLEQNTFKNVNPNNLSDFYLDNGWNTFHSQQDDDYSRNIQREFLSQSIKLDIQENQNQYCQIDEKDQTLKSARIQYRNKKSQSIIENKNEIQLAPLTHRYIVSKQLEIFNSGINQLPEIKILENQQTIEQKNLFHSILFDVNEQNRSEQNIILPNRYLEKKQFSQLNKFGNYKIDISPTKQRYIVFNSYKQQPKKDKIIIKNFQMPYLKQIVSSNNQNNSFIYQKEINSKNIDQLQIQGKLSNQNQGLNNKLSIDLYLNDELGTLLSDKRSLFKTKQKNDKASVREFLLFHQEKIFKDSCDLQYQNNINNYSSHQFQNPLVVSSVSKKRKISQNSRYSSLDFKELQANQSFIRPQPDQSIIECLVGNNNLDSSENLQFNQRNLQQSVMDQIYIQKFDSNTLSNKQNDLIIKNSNLYQQQNQIYDNIDEFDVRKNFPSFKEYLVDLIKKENDKYVLVETQKQRFKIKDSNQIKYQSVDPNLKKAFMNLIKIQNLSPNSYQKNLNNENQYQFWKKKQLNTLKKDDFKSYINNINDQTIDQKPSVFIKNNEIIQINQYLDKSELIYEK